MITALIRSCNCQTRDWAMATLLGLNHAPSNKSSVFRPSLLSCNNGTTNCGRTGGNVFFIVFNTGQALPLVFTRMLRPLNSRGRRAQCPPKRTRLSPRSPLFRAPAMTAHRPRTQLIHVREQSLSLLNPRRQSCQRSVRIRRQAAARTVRDQALAAEAKRPRTSQRRGLSASPNSPRTRTVHKLPPAEECAHHQIVLSVTQPTSFPIPIGSAPSNVLI